MSRSAGCTCTPLRLNCLANRVNRVDDIKPLPRGPTANSNTRRASRRTWCRRSVVPRRQGSKWAVKGVSAGRWVPGAVWAAGTSWGRVPCLLDKADDEEDESDEEEDDDDDDDDDDDESVDSV